jgi:two-component system, OmpR family, sensor kinase
VLGVIVLAAFGLAVADVATYASLRGFLLDRTDQSLRESPFGGPGRGGPGEAAEARSCPQEGRPIPGARPGDYFELRSASGDVICGTQAAGFSEALPSPPDLPETTALPAEAQGPGAGRFFTVDAEDGDGRYRVRAVRARDGTVAILARSLDDVDATLRRLLVIMLLVSAAVLGALAVLGLWVVRLGLRPLDAIGATAAQIAAGDLSRRVERAESRTEVGRLGLALNAMLERIESAFRAQEASERKLRRFVADASHELRTPLAGVRSYAELFERGADRRPDDLARAMAGITRESERMSLLVDDLFLLARLDEGRPLAREPVALERVVEEAVETARAVEPGRPYSLETEPAEVVGDRDRLRQVVDNLLSNVRAHTPPGAPVAVRVARRNGAAVVEVADSGPGIDPDEADRVFERFYRTDETRARATGGVGLGLSIVAAVAKAHGGSASAESEPGSGATFRIALPLATNGHGG